MLGKGSESAVFFCHWFLPDFEVCCDDLGDLLGVVARKFVW